MALTEKKCSVCGKFSWDSDFGAYREEHENPRTGKTEKCDTNGGTYVDGVRQ
ncbi:hypothetical protein [Lentzea flaviverrucosa]|uniref:Uncharacterized protein n=1 Tax=Lentzea flaviverrucosa TaxID=200379 RepID=A0A1H9XKH9_9PSEU|nr:hypothetical protein [Lentzea flaviverrucosa]RDI20334.1 hypothetical protein DFR72_115177 [Lentzea flaviverrucosa]SES46632.1 hypothetical protein SAMN05216195_115177 [Lentzea flaviverrucosa]